MGAKGINVAETQVQNALLTEGTKRGRGTKPEESTLIMDCQDLKRRREDKENGDLKFSEVEETSWDWSQAYK